MFHLLYLLNISACFSPIDFLKLTGRAGSCWSKDIKVVQDSENPNEYTVTATVDAGGFSNTPGEYYIEFMITGNEGPFMWNGMFRNIFLD